MNRVLMVATVMTACTGLVLSGWASGPDPDAVPAPEEVYARVMSPFCPSLVLADCPTSQAAGLRAGIDEKIRGGWTNRRIDEWLVQNYSSRVLARPSDGFAWVPPVLWAVSGALLVGVVVSRLGARRPKPPDQLERGASEEERSRLEEELRAFARGTE